MINANTNVVGNAAFVWLGTAAFGGAAGQLHYKTNATLNQTLVEGDTNGDRIADFQLALIGLKTLGGILTSSFTAAGLSSPAHL